MHRPRTAPRSSTWMQLPWRPSPLLTPIARRASPPTDAARPRIEYQSLSLSLSLSLRRYSALLWCSPDPLVSSRHSLDIFDLSEKLLRFRARTRSLAVSALRAMWIIAMVLSLRGEISCEPIVDVGCLCNCK